MCRCEDRPCCGCHLEEGDGYVDPHDLDDMADMEPPDRGDEEEEVDSTPLDERVEGNEDRFLDSHWESRFESGNESYFED